MTGQRIAFILLTLAVSASSSFSQTPPRLSLRDAEQRALAGHPDIAGATSPADGAGSGSSTNSYVDVWGAPIAVFSAAKADCTSPCA